VWKRAAFENAYSSPILIEAGGRKQVVAVGAKQIVSLDPESGETIWTQDHETDYGIAVSTPVWNGAGLLFVSSAYGKGAQVFRVTATTATRVWADAKLQSHFGTGVVRDGVLYFLSGYNGPAFLTAVDFETGKVRWPERGFSKGQLLLSGNLLVVLDQEGVLGLVRADPARFQELARWQALEKSAWTPPTLVGSRLYLRDRKTIMALELANR
jgi:outer membrane protein assembly factor BamB